MPRVFLSLLKILIAPVVTLFLAYALFRFPQILIGLAQLKAILIPIFGLFLSGPAWYGYGRLSAFDKLEGLNADRRAQINTYAQKTRRALVKEFLIAGGLILLMLIGLLITEPTPTAATIPNAGLNTEIIISSILVSVSICFFIRSFLIIMMYLPQIETNRNTVAEWQQQETARRSLIKRLKELEKSEPL